MRIKHPLLYNTLLLPFELLLIRRWRRRLWSQLPGSRILEVGVGTGLNTPYYGRERYVTALDLGKEGLQSAARLASRLGVEAQFIQGDVEALPFSGESFDAVAATFLFCSVANPQRGLAEIMRVLKPGGTLLLLEHVRSSGMTGRLMDTLASPFYRIFDEHIARETDKLVGEAGFVNVTIQPLFLDVVKLMRAEKP